MRKRIAWTICLALIGALLSTKSAVIEPLAVMLGAFVGGMIGFVIGALLSRN